jgi:hypothetical protein
MRTMPIFQKFQKKYFFSFSIWGYDLICKTYSGKLFIVQEKQFWCEHTPIELYEETHIRKEDKEKG